MAKTQSLARIGSWEWNIDTGESAWSRELYRLMAVDPATPEDELGRASQERIHPDDRHLYEEAIAAAVAHSRPFRFEQRLVLPAGERLAVVTGEVTHDERGRVVRGTVRDVTEWRKAQDESAHGRLALEAMQAACLPASMPEAPGIELDARYRPAHEGDRLGGDWYDAFALPDGRVGLVVGDVTGHGLAAAGIMSQLRNALRAFASDGATPAVVLDAVARFQRQQAIDTLATCLYVVLDPRDGSFEWARAGHPPLLVVGPDTWTSFEVGGGPPLGVSGPGYADQREVLPPGALLVLYTDGLVEERSETIDVGIAALGSFVGDRRDRPVSLIVDEAVEALGTNRTSIDDVCLLLVRRNGA